MTAARVAALLTWLGTASAAFTQEATSPAQVLLVPRPAAGALDLVDPGSGLRLAAIALDTGPRRSAVAPDGRRAAVLGCLESAPGRQGPVALSVVDLERPGETRRIPLYIEICPGSLTWMSATSVALYDAARVPLQAIDVESGQATATPQALALARLEDRIAVPPVIDPATIAVQQFLADGGRLEDLAVAPVVPRATCRACAPSP